MDHLLSGLAPKLDNRVQRIQNHHHVGAVLAAVARETQSDRRRPDGLDVARKGSGLSARDDRGDVGARGRARVWHRFQLRVDALHARGLRVDGAEGEQAPRGQRGRGADEERRLPFAKRCDEVDARKARAQVRVDPLHLVLLQPVVKHDGGLAAGFQRAVERGEAGIQSAADDARRRRPQTSVVAQHHDRVAGDARVKVEVADGCDGQRASLEDDGAP
mmetsp:Transcript_8749/g.28787  ORF Transcript_8749/g.28787 Transcript_8749/m.28787 type:complete len:218 (-) Transcript_8749:313-966(-)